MISIHGWWRRLRLRLTGKELLVTGGCRQCGKCCQRLQIQHGRRWLRSKKQFQALVREHPAYACFEICDRDRNGLLVFNCTLLGNDGRCRAYTQRPLICRDFPNKGIFWCGAALPIGCGYTLSEGVPFARILRRAQQKTAPSGRPQRDTSAD